MTKKLRVGIIGAGWPGRQHARALQAGDRAILHACSEQEPERAAEFAQIFSPNKIYSDYADLLGDSAVAVVICLHFPATLAALEAGKHVLCEKSRDFEPPR